MGYLEDLNEVIKIQRFQTELTKIFSRKSLHIHPQKSLQFKKERCKLKKG
jgi:hypothetical protein